jgi:hypothetical protein
MLKDLIDYIVIREKSIKRFSSPESKNRFPMLYHLIKLATSKKYTVVKEFRRERFGMGPDLYIFKRNNSE